MGKSSKTLDRFWRAVFRHAHPDLFIADINTCSVKPDLFETFQLGNCSLPSFTFFCHRAQLLETKIKFRTNGFQTRLPTMKRNLPNGVKATNERITSNQNQAE